MGSSTWSTASYESKTQSKISSGTSFGYNSRAHSSGRFEAHSSLDPVQAIATDGPHKGKLIRESRDSVEHPTSLPIIIGFDSTGSMGHAPFTMQEKLPKVFSLLKDKGYVEHPQIAVATYGDAYCDRVPLQFSQFESDNRIDDNLDNMFIEQGGGGNGGETATTLLYFASHHTSTDSFEKRGKRGYLFLIADERMLEVTESQMRSILGSDVHIESGLSPEALAIEVLAKWEVVILHLDTLSAQFQNAREQYVSLFGENHVLPVSDMDNIAETIASAIGVLENKVTSTSLAKDLNDVGSSALVIREVTQSVARLDGTNQTLVNLDDSDSSATRL